MGKRREVSPRATAAALMLASQSAFMAARSLAYAEGQPVGTPLWEEAETSTAAAAIDLAGALVFLSTLSRRDKRFDFDVLRATMLEFLPRLVVSEPGDIKPENMVLVGKQIDAIAQEILVHVQAEPKKMTFIRATPAEPDPVESREIDLSEADGG